MGTIAGGERVAGEQAPSVTDLAYRPYLDGLRAVAVYLVVLFHAGSGRFSGGYVGVDVFFVLSGFLVTQILLQDLGRGGAIRFGRFTLRRFRRLLPAAFVALIVTAVVYTAIASPSEVSESVGSFKAAFLYSANWYFIHQSTGYFGADLASNPVLQFWSLAIEEQFYLLWPLTLGGLFVLTRRLDHSRRIRAVRIVVGVGALASLVWALSLRHTDPNRAYYGTDARAYQLLAGALLALTPAFIARAKRHRVATRAVTVAGITALLVLASSWVDLDAIERGAAVTIATCALIVALEAADGGLVQRALSNSGVVYLGKVSYGTYLWHWLVILVAVRTFHLSTISTIGIACLVSTALASLSFVVLERPIRLSALLDRRRRLVIATGLAVSVVSTVVVIPKIVDPARASAPTPTLQDAAATAGFTPVPSNLDVSTARDTKSPFPNCDGKPPDQCVLVRGTGRHLLLIGDSHARMFIPTLTEIARKEHLTLSVSIRGLCPWQHDLYAPQGNVTVTGTRLTLEGCRAQKDDLYARVVPALRPDVVVAVNATYGGPNQLVTFLDRDGQPPKQPSDLARLLRTTTTASVARLRADGAKVLIVEPIPLAPSNPLDCLSKAKVVEQCSYVASAFPDQLELLYRGLAKQDRGVWSADLDRLVCPFLPICDPIVNGHIVKWDRTHLTIDFAKSIAPQVDRYLAETGAIPG